MKFSIICVAVVVITLSFNEYCVEAICCDNWRYIRYNCGDNTCSRAFCKDGTELNGMFCGYGPCNIFGCNCPGDRCRDNHLGTWSEAIRAFRQDHNF